MALCPDHGLLPVGAASLLVPLYALALGAGPLFVGALEATAGPAGVPGALLWGRLSDHTGQRRAFVLFSLAGIGDVLDEVGVEFGCHRPAEAG